MQEKGNRDGSQSLEELIEQSLRQTVSFDTTPAVLQQRGKEKPNLQQRLIEKMPAAAAVASAALSIPGNPIYTPAAVGAITYFLVDRAAGIAADDEHFKQRKVGQDTSADVYNRLFGFKLPFSMISGVAAFGGSAVYDFYKRQLDLGSDFIGFYSGLFQQLPNLTSEIAFGVVNGLGAYVLLSGLERALHSESLATAAHIVAAKFDKITRKPKKAISHLERLANVPHSKEKEVAILLQLGDACIEAGQNAEAMNAYKRMLRVSARKDESAGVSDWLVRRVGKNKEYLRGSSDEEGTYTNVQRAMHEFANGKLATANSILTQAVAAEPGNRQLRRVRALFFEATKNEAAADLEMRIYEELLQRDPTLAYRAVGESRNEVLVPQDDSAQMPDVYIIRSRNKALLDEMAANIAAFSQELPGMLPRVIRQRSDGEYHYIVLESMGNATMHQKALNSTLTYSDAKAVLDLLVKVMAAGSKLSSEGKINVGKPAEAQSYVYSIASDPSIAEQFRNAGVSPVQPNVQDGFPMFFVHRAMDLFLARVQASNGVEFSDEYTRKVQEGIAVLSLAVLQDPSVWAVYTDFTRRNLIFDCLNGNLAGKVDWESVRTMPWLFELVNVLEFYGPNLGPAAYNDLMNHFVSRFEKEMHVHMDRRLLRTEYSAAASLRHLELIGYRSRDTATNPENVRAQVYHHLMARMHLFETARLAAKDRKQPLEEMLAALETEPILKDVGQQRQIEEEIRPLISANLAYTWHEMAQKSYWQWFFKDVSPQSLKRLASPKELAGMWQSLWHPKPSPFKDSGFALPATFLIGFPSTMAAVAAYAVLSYVAMQKIMPHL